MWSVLVNFLLKILFGPWFYVNDRIDQFRGENRSEFFWASTFLIVLAVSLFGIRAYQKRHLYVPDPSIAARLSRKIVLVALGVALLGGFCNVVAIAANNFSMPGVGDPDYADSRLKWLSDHINSEANPATRFLYSYHPTLRLLSIGDFLLAALNIVWWVFLYWGIAAIVRYGRCIFRRHENY